MLKEVLLLNEEAKVRLVDSVCQLEKESDKTREKLRKLSADQLVYTLFTGMLQQDNRLLFSPLPNYVFTRDIGAVVNDHIIICHARKRARSRLKWAAGRSRVPPSQPFRIWSFSCKGLRNS